MKKLGRHEQMGRTKKRKRKKLCLRKTESQQSHTGKKKTGKGKPVQEKVRTGTSSQRRKRHSEGGKTVELVKEKNKKKNQTSSQPPAVKRMGLSPSNAKTKGGGVPNQGKESDTRLKKGCTDGDHLGKDKEKESANHVPVVFMGKRREPYWGTSEKLDKEQQVNQDRKKSGGET